MDGARRAGETTLEDELVPFGALDVVAAARRPLRVRAARVGLVDDDRVPGLLPDTLPDVVPLGVVDRRDHVRLALPEIEEPLLVVRGADDLERLAEEPKQLVLPLNGQRRRHQDETPGDGLAELELLDEKPGHDRHARAGVVREQEAQPALRQHLQVDGLDLMRQRADAREAHREPAVVGVGETDARGFHEQPHGFGVCRGRRPALVRVGREQGRKVFARQYRLVELAVHLPDAQLGANAQRTGAHDGDRVDEVSGQHDTAAHEILKRGNVRHCGRSYAEQCAGRAARAGAHGRADRTHRAQRAQPRTAIDRPKAVEVRGGVPEEVTPSALQCPLDRHPRSHGRFRHASTVSLGIVGTGRHAHPVGADPTARRGAGPGRRRLRSRDRRHAPRPGAGGLADVAADPRRVGLQPPRPDRPVEHRRPAPRVDAGPDPRQPAGHPARLPRRALHAEPGRRHPGHRRRDRRPRVGAPARSARRHLRPRRPARRHQPQPRHLRPAHHRHQRRQLRLRPRRGDRRDRLGDPHPRLPHPPRDAQRGADHRRRQGRVGAELPPRRGARGLRHHRPRRPHRGRAVAPAHHPRARRARRRDLGRRTRRRAQARRKLDAPELRPRAEPGLRRHVGHLAGPQVHARRRRPRAPVPQLDPSPSTPTPARSPGTTST